MRQYRSWPSLHSPTPLPPFQRKEGYLVGFVHALIVIQSEPSRICSRLSVVAACVHISVMHACWPGDEMTRPVSRGLARESNTKPQHQHSELLYLFTCLNPPQIPIEFREQARLCNCLSYPASSRSRYPPSSQHYPPIFTNSIFFHKPPHL